MEKRNIQISLEEAKEWYNSGDSFKRELALKAYNKNELYIDIYSNILRSSPSISIAFLAASSELNVTIKVSG